VRRALAGAAAGFLLFACAAAALGDQNRPPTLEWLRQARVAGAQLFSEMSGHEIEKSVSALFDQHVSVIEADSDLSRWLGESEFARELAFMRRYADAAHRRGMRVAW